MLEIVVSNIAPCTLPAAAYGPQPIEWHNDPAPVWAWVSWPHRATERLEAFARGWNDRVVIVEWTADRGTLSTVVWRNAVTRREEDFDATERRALTSSVHAATAGRPPRARP